MTDFERCIDSIRIHMCKTDEERQIVKSYIRGKTNARIEIMIVSFVVIVGIIIVKGVL